MMVGKFPNASSSDKSLQNVGHCPTTDAARDPAQTAGVAELAGHAMKACANAAGSARGVKYATALSAQAQAMRRAADLIDRECLRQLMSAAADLDARAGL